jgi:hypothetical protein
VVLVVWFFLEGSMPPCGVQVFSLLAVSEKTNAPSNSNLSSLRLAVILSSIISSLYNVQQLTMTMQPHNPKTQCQTMQSPQSMVLMQSYNDGTDAVPATRRRKATMQSQSMVLM